MFEQIYIEFITKINEVDLQNNKDLILVNEKKLRSEMQRFFLIMFKSKDYVVKAFKILNVTQKRYEDEIKQINKRLQGVKAKLKRGRRGKSPIRQKSQKAVSPYSKRNMVRNNDSKAKSNTRINTNLKTNKRSQTPKPNAKPKSGGKNISRRDTSKHKKAQTQRHIQRKSSVSKSKGKSKEAVKKNTSAVKKHETTLKVKVNKNLLSTKLLAHKESLKFMENPLDKKHPASPIQLDEALFPNDSRTSLKNNTLGNRTSIFEFSKNNLNQVLLSRDFSQRKRESFVDLRSAIKHFQGKLVADPGIKPKEGEKGIKINQIIISKKFQKKIEKRTTKKPTVVMEPIKDEDSDSDISAMNPFDM